VRWLSGFLALPTTTTTTGHPHRPPHPPACARSGLRDGSVRVIWQSARTGRAGASDALTLDNAADRLRYQSGDFEEAGSLMRNRTTFKFVYFIQHHSSGSCDRRCFRSSVHGPSLASVPTAGRWNWIGSKVCLQQHFRSMRFRTPVSVPRCHSRLSSIESVGSGCMENTATAGSAVSRRQCNIVPQQVRLLPSAFDFRWLGC
jgi:hypothetical protein